jgi:hypothetical protein
MRIFALLRYPAKNYNAYNELKSEHMSLILNCLECPKHKLVALILRSWRGATSNINYYILGPHHLASTLQKCEALILKEISKYYRMKKREISKSKYRTRLQTWGILYIHQCFILVNFVRSKKKVTYEVILKVSKPGSRIDYAIKKII